MTEIRSQPCSACPYRQDCPSGVWDASEYDKLPPYDAPTFEQPLSAFVCHVSPSHLCNGWAVCHSNRGHEYELASLRLLGITAPVIRRPSMMDIPLFESGSDAAMWGYRDLYDPGPYAVKTIERLMRKYPRLRSSADTEV